MLKDKTLRLGYFTNLLTKGALYSRVNRILLSGLHKKFKITAIKESNRILYLTYKLLIGFYKKLCLLKVFYHGMVR